MKINVKLRRGPSDDAGDVFVLHLKCSASSHSSDILTEFKTVWHQTGYPWEDPISNALLAWIQTNTNSLRHQTAGDFEYQLMTPPGPATEPRPSNMTTASADAASSGPAIIKARRPGFREPNASAENAEGGSQQAGGAPGPCRSRRPPNLPSPPARAQVSADAPDSPPPPADAPPAAAVIRPRLPFRPPK